MTRPFFDGIAPVTFAGPTSSDPLSFRHYDADRVVAGKTLKEHLRFAVAWWHSFAWPGTDPFGGATFERPWWGDDLASARAKADAAFEMFGLLGQPFYCFHDADIRPEGASFAQTAGNLSAMVDYLGEKMAVTGTRLLWGTANLFSHRRYMAGAATNPDPDIYAYAAATVKTCLDATHRLGGENYVLWGGREGYETLLNTDLAREEAQAARFLSAVIDYKHKIGFQGTILVEPKPQEPSKHQYDFDVATCHGFLARHGLEGEVKLNIEAGHAFLAGHSFEHEIALAQALGAFGSIDMNRNDLQSGWDTDQFPNDLGAVTLAYYEILKGGGFGTGGTNFDAKLRRQSLDPSDLLAAHVGAMDLCARAVMAAAAMLEDGGLEAQRADRYAGWDAAAGREILGAPLDILAERAMTAPEPRPRSGRQELLEAHVARFL